jgi:hypothetical protein
VIAIFPNAFWAPKDEQAPEDWEDGCAFDRGNARFAVADGASAAYRAREWARHLVSSYVLAPPAPDGDEQAALRWFAQSAQDWQGTAQRAPVAWYHQDAERRGSFAAFLGARFLPAGPALRWHSIAVGDCCLFQVRDGEVATAFPVSDPADFGQSPVLVPTAEHSLDRLRGKVQTRSGEALPGDLFLLCSDALAKFVLEHASRDGTLWRALTSVPDNEEFGQLVRYLRSENAIDVDDVTLLRLVLRAG